ncbi:MAG: hypothetical protein LAQ69_31765 [Acidobacteriia bacterium]|nr:hypothetical protein [Terriglobia bacterium]
MGKVFRVRNLLSQRVEAMKIVLPDSAADPGLADRFLREIRVHASLEHPHIAHLRTALRVENQVVMIMELVEGQPGGVPAPRHRRSPRRHPVRRPGPLRPRIRPLARRDPSGH